MSKQYQITVQHLSTPNTAWETEVFDNDKCDKFINVFKRGYELNAGEVGIISIVCANGERVFMSVEEAKKCALIVREV